MEYIMRIYNLIDTELDHTPVFISKINEEFKKFLETCDVIDWSVEITDYIVGNSIYRYYRNLEFKDFPREDTRYINKARKMMLENLKEIIGSLEKIII